MARDEIAEIQSRRWQIAQNLSVAAGGSQTSDEVSANDKYNRFAAAYNINTLLGSAEARLQVNVGHDVNGNDVWVTVATSTSESDVFEVDMPVEKVRVQIVETGGTSGLDGINIWLKGRAL